jgi:hypothetical protein
LVSDVLRQHSGVIFKVLKKPEGKRPIGKPTHRWQIIIYFNLLLIPDV